MKFDDAREFVDFMKDQSKRIWISADDPESMMLKAVDESLKYVLELRIEDYKLSSHLLSKDERAVFEKYKNYWVFAGAELSGHLKYLLSVENLQGMANFIRRNLLNELEQSLLRTKGDVELLTPGSMPCYGYDSDVFYYIDETGEKLIEKDGVIRVMLPYIEINQTSLKECENIWDFSVDDFFKKNEISRTENRLYETIAEKVTDKITVPIRENVTVLPVTDWANGKMGFHAFEILSVGAPK